LKGLEEERRLAYVGLTRARLRVFVSFAGSRRIHGQWQNTARSRFIDELPAGHIEMRNEMGLAAGGTWSGAWGSSASQAAPAKAATSPGWDAAWNRSKTWAGTRPPLLIQSPGVPRRGQEIPKIGGFAVGDRVFHQKFGYGTVEAVEDNKLAINFEHAGDKKVMDAFVEKT
jgi:DNA helicase-2/ATP-dependent DNA helicase PcrA